jgi:Fe-Mn family superoxide dismutase
VPANDPDPKLRRRDVLAGTLAGAGALALGRSSAAASPLPSTPTSAAIMSQADPFQLPPLPYSDDALAPHITPKTMGFHYGKHHNAYVVNLNNLVKGTELASLTLEQVILKVAKDDTKKGVFNNAAQVWNHTFYWNSMKPKGGGAPKGKLAKLIDASFGSLDAFKEQFKKAAAGQFGSGWAWLVVQGDKLAITTTGNADLPLVHGQKALLTCDVWEHAYYLDFQNRRPDYLTAFCDSLVNWEFAEKNLG